MAAPEPTLQMEARLREQVAMLKQAGLSDDEAMLIALRRISDMGPPAQAEGLAQREALVAFGLAVLAALAFKLPELFGVRLDDNDTFYARNFSLFVFPCLAAYFVWKRGATMRTGLWLITVFVAAAIFANVYPFASAGYPQELTALHTPIMLWLAVDIAYGGGRWSDAAVRMNFVRYSGELFIYYVLIALGGGVLSALMMVLFAAIGMNLQIFFGHWLLPCGALGAVVIGSWLVETKRGVMENVAPMLTRLFTPMSTLLLLAFLATMLITGRGLEFQRELIIALDMLLVVVLGLLLYAISARDPRQPAGLFDVLQVVLVISALLVDGMALWVIAARIHEFGFTPNRVAALGENILLLVNLTVSAVLYVRFLRGDGVFTTLERWQTSYLPVYAVWAAIVVIAFPPLFGAI